MIFAKPPADAIEDMGLLLGRIGALAALAVMAFRHWAIYETWSWSLALTSARPFWPLFAVCFALSLTADFLRSLKRRGVI
jgi:hypothetical protein